jgi:alcohol dehydrogenase class IV
MSAEMTASYRDRVEFLGPDRVIFGWDIVDSLGELIGRSAKVHLVVDKHVSQDPILVRAIDSVRDRHELSVWEHDGSEPVLEDVIGHGSELSKESIVVGVGGGSTIDTAKALALMLAGARDLEAYEGADRFDFDLPRIIAVPTTAGTGSEVTGSCVLTSGKMNRKISIRSRKLQPSVAVLDPHFLASVPKQVIRSSGIDALAHAIEAYFSTRANPVTDGLALRAMSLVTPALPVYYANPADRCSAEAMIWGSCIAGIAFNSARVGLAHAVASAIGPSTKLSHGVCVGLGLHQAVRINLPTLNGKLSAMMAALGARIQSGQSAEQAILADLRALYAAIELPWTAADAGRHFDVDDRLIDDIVGSGRLNTNPVRVGREQLRSILSLINGASPRGETWKPA